MISKVIPALIFIKLMDQSSKLKSNREKALLRKMKLKLGIEVVGIELVTESSAISVSISLYFITNHPSVEP